MDGILSPDILNLRQLEVLNLSSNAFQSTLPPQWSSASLILLDLSKNRLFGPLPVAYGSKETFPKLANIFLQNNAFSGPLPGPEWTTTGFAPQVVIVLRPGNENLCGRVTIVDPRFYQAIPNDQGSPQLLINDLAQWGNFSQAYLIYRGMLGMTNASPTPPTNVVITNTLGSCATPCGRTAPLVTNLLDATWENNVTLSDIVNYNPSVLPTTPPGTLLALPCYPADQEPAYFGSDAAMYTFAGGNQLSIAGTVGAELAGGVVTRQGLNKTTSFYTGIYDYDLSGSTAKEALVQPVYWFTQLEASFTISALTITSGEPMFGISVFIGNDTTSVFGNTFAAQNLTFGVNDTKPVALERHFKGTMVILYAGYQGPNNSLPTMSLANAKIWPQEGNAAQSKPIFASSQIADMNITTDGSLETCTLVTSNSTGFLWFGVDLGYEAEVSTVVLTVEKAPGFGRIFVSMSKEDTLSNATMCGTLPLTFDAPGGERQAIQCDIQGQYVGVLIENSMGDAFSICELEVYLEDTPAEATPSISISSSQLVGIAVGSAIGGAVAFFLILFLLYTWRRRRRQGVSKGKISADTSNTISQNDSHGSWLFPFVSRRWLAISPQGSNSSKSNLLDAGNHLGSPAIKSSNESASQSTDLSKFSSGYDIVQFSDIELIRTIGEGSFGLVWMAKYLQTTVAVKVLTHDMKHGMGIEAQSKPSDAVLSALQKEASIMAALRHPNCIQYLGAMLDPPALIMEYCSKRSVDRILAEALLDPKAAKQLDWVHLMSMATDAAKGMYYLHTRSPPIIHRDLKSPNLLVDALWHVKISDFNLSRALEENATVSSLQITNPRWLAPEVLKGAQADKASDVYSFGVVLWELMTWELPWGHNTNPFSIINSVTSGNRLRLPTNSELAAGSLSCYDEYIELIEMCWNPDPSKRPMMDAIVQKLRVMLTGMVQSLQTKNADAINSNSTSIQGGTSNGASNGGSGSGASMGHNGNGESDPSPVVVNINQNGVVANGDVHT